jgi:hypothetical protein
MEAKRRILATVGCVVLLGLVCLVRGSHYLALPGFY